MGGMVMPYCPNCRSEYKEGIVRCVDCGAALVPGSPPPVVEPKFSNEELVLIYEASNAVKVSIIRGVLEEAGIPVWETGNMVKTVYPFTVGPLAEESLYVPASRVEDAKLALEKALEKGGDS